MPKGVVLSVICCSWEVKNLVPNYILQFIHSISDCDTQKRIFDECYVRQIINEIIIKFLAVVCSSWTLYYGYLYVYF